MLIYQCLTYILINPITKKIDFFKIIIYNILKYNMKLIERNNIFLLIRYINYYNNSGE